MPVVHCWALGSAYAGAHILTHDDDSLQYHGLQRRRGHLCQYVEFDYIQFDVQWNRGQIVQ